jgi:hypothetical protein
MFHTSSDVKLPKDTEGKWGCKTQNNQKIAMVHFSNAMLGKVSHLTLRVKFGDILNGSTYSNW